MCDKASVAQSCPTLCDPWTVAHQAPLFLEFSRQEYWSGFPFPSPADLPNPGIKPGYPALQANSLPSEPPGKPSVIKLRIALSNPDITSFGRNNIIFMSLGTYVICPDCDRIKSQSVNPYISIFVNLLLKNKKEMTISIFSLLCF